MSIDRKAPCSFASAMPAASIRLACSRVSTPARIAAAMPLVPCACAATFRSRWCASSTIARISVSPSCCWPGSVFREITPPVAQILITWAPYLRTSRSRLRPSSGLSTLYLLRDSSEGGN
jgi:hypothetical protein